MEETKGAAKRMRSRAIDYQMTFSTPHGKRVLHDLMKWGHVLHPTFKKDPHETAFQEGERHMVLRLLTVLKTNVEALNEHIDQIEEERTE